MTLVTGEPFEHHKDAAELLVDFEFRLCLPEQGFRDAGRGESRDIQEFQFPDVVECEP